MNADLRDFVKETLVQVIQGIADARSEAKKVGASVNPVLAIKSVKRRPVTARPDDEPTEDIYGKGIRLDRENLALANILETADGGIADVIEFDVAITTAAIQSAGSKTSSEKGGGVEIKVVSAKLDYGTGTDQSLQTTDSQISRIKFKIPVAFPQQYI